jgi:peptide/nickel transport system substrate-binding protein
MGRRALLARAAALGLTVAGAEWLFSPAAFGASAVPSGTLNVTLGTISTLDPLTSSAFVTDLSYMNAIYEGLIGYKPGTYDVVNLLAEEFTPSKDGKTFKFRLKQGIPFQGDYGEVTANDVKFSYERIADPKQQSPNAGDWSALAQVKVTGKYTGEIRLKHPFSPLMRTTLPLASGYVVSAAAVKERKKAFGRRPIGSGPYELVELVADQRATLRAFSEYGKSSKGVIPPPAWQEIRGTIRKSDTAAVVALEAGDTSFVNLPPKEVDRIGSKQGLKVAAHTTTNFYFVSMNTTHPNLKNLNVRRAVRYAVDVPSMLEVGFSGRAAQAYSMIPKTMGVGYWPSAPKYRRNVDRAKAFLERAGATPELEYVYNSDLGVGGEDTAAMAQVFQASLADAGIKVNLKAFSSAVVNEYAAKQDKAQLVYAPYGASVDPYWSFIWFVSSQKDWNWWFLKSAEYDRLNDAATRTTNIDQRTRMYIRMQQIADRFATCVWLANPQVYHASRSNVVPVFTPLGLPLFRAFRRT